MTLDVPSLNQFFPRNATLIFFISHQVLSQLFYTVNMQTSLNTIASEAVLNYIFGTLCRVVHCELLFIMYGYTFFSVHTVHSIKGGSIWPLCLGNMK